MFEHPAVSLSTEAGDEARLATFAYLAHDGERLVAGFRCHFDRLRVNPLLPRDRSVDGLWALDVVELFISTDPARRRYREIEVTPLGQWLTYAFDAPRVRAAEPWEVRPEVTAVVGESVFDVTLGVPLAELGLPPAGGVFHVGLFRIYGEEPAREYLSLLPGHASVPDFHRPERWAAAVLD